MTNEEYIPNVRDKSFDKSKAEEGYNSDSKSFPLDDHNGWADFWYYEIGANVIPADTQNKTTSTS